MNYDARNQGNQRPSRVRVPGARYLLLSDSSRHGPRSWGADRRPAGALGGPPGGTAGGLPLPWALTQAPECSHHTAALRREQAAREGSTALKVTPISTRSYCSRQPVLGGRARAEGGPEWQEKPGPRGGPAPTQAGLGVKGDVLNAPLSLGQSAPGEEMVRAPAARVFARLHLEVAEAALQEGECHSPPLPPHQGVPQVPPQPGTERRGRGCTRDSCSSHTVREAPVLSMHPSIYEALYLSTHPSIHLFIIYLSIYEALYHLSIYISDAPCPSIHPSII